MIKVTRIYNMKQVRNDKHLYMIEFRHLEDNWTGGFTEYISDEDLPKVNDTFSSVPALTRYCKGK